jgi:hypothetical protein
MSYIKYSKDGKVKFDHERHTYHLGDTLLTSVTTFISKYKVPFDAERIATAYAKKHGLDKQKLLAQWKLEGEISCENGTAVHRIFEEYCNTREIFISGDYPKEEIASKFIEDFFWTKRLVPVECEMIVYNNKLAGQIDCIAKNSEGQYFILDWKTNKEIKYNGYNKYMSEPYGFLPDCNYSHYTLQLNIYKHLCKEYDIAGMYIVHLGTENYSLIKADNLNIKI